MYPYHNKIKQRIRNGELVDYMFVDDYKDIGECLLLFFNTAPHSRPIRPHKYSEYVDILADWNRGNKNGSNPQRNDGGTGGNGMTKQIDVFGNEISSTELSKQFQEIEQKHRKRYKPMQELYGLTPNKTCKTCKHCLKIDYHCKTYYKCELWVISNSEATDIRLKNNACGKYESEVDTE